MDNLQDKPREGQKCYSCQKREYYARDCCGRKMQPYLVNMMLRKDEPPVEQAGGACETTGVPEEQESRKINAIVRNDGFEDCLKEVGTVLDNDEEERDLLLGKWKGPRITYDNGIIEYRTVPDLEGDELDRWFQENWPEMAVPSQRDEKST